MLFDYWKNVTPLLEGLPQDTEREAIKALKRARRSLEKQQRGIELVCGVETVEGHPLDSQTLAPLRDNQGNVQVVRRFSHFVIYNRDDLHHAALQAGDHARALGATESRVHAIHRQNMRLGKIA